jgi:hypothetical protein
MVASTPTWEHLAVLAPAIVIGAGLVAAVFILLGKALAQSIRESGHPRVIVGGFVALAGVIALLTYLGVELPRE